MAGRPFLPDDLANLKFAQLTNHPLTERQTNGQRREAGCGCAERDVLRHVQHRQLRMREIQLSVQEVVQHQPRSTLNLSTIRSVRMPREPLTSTRSPARTNPAMELAASSLVAK